MTVLVDHDEDQCQLVVHVACKDVSSNREIDNSFNDIDSALSKIEESLGNSEIYFFLISIKAKGVPPGSGEFDPYGEDYPLGPRNPWQVFCPLFWTKACAVPHLRRRVKDYIVRLEKTLKLAQTHSRATDSLWEHDETQLGEPLATHLALLDVEFVSYYMRLLRLWDPGHEVHIRDSVIEIVKRHGVRAETEELMLCYTAWAGCDETLPELLQHAKDQ